jgi:hypothetical protein
MKRVRSYDQLHEAQLQGCFVVGKKRALRRSWLGLICQRSSSRQNGIYGHSRFCNTDFDDKLACLNLSGV